MYAKNGIQIKNSKNHMKHVSTTYKNIKIKVMCILIMHQWII